MAQGAGYTFNPDTVSGTTVRDLAGYFLHGTITGSAAIDAGGKYSQGLHCTGGAMRVANIDEFAYPVNTDGGVAFAAWVKLDTTTAAARCIASATSSGALNWALYASNASGNVELKCAGTTYSTSTSIRDGAYHHVMFVHDKVVATDTVTVYVDGTSVLSTTATTSLTYSGNVTMDVGRNALSSAEALTGIVDDCRWWNDPVESTYVSTVMGAEQIDFQLAIYSFDANTANDGSTYTGQNLTVAGTGTFTTGLYGRALVSGATEAGASGTIGFPDCDRLNMSGWVRVDTLPGTSAPILAITDASGNSRVRVVVNSTGTITATWVTISYGTLSATTVGTVTAGVFARIQVSMNPTFIGIKLNSAAEVQTSTGNSTPFLTPTVNHLERLYIGGDASAGGRVTWDYLTLTKNFINDTTRYWAGAPVISAPPGNVPRGMYTMNENTGTTAADRGPSSNNLTLMSAGSWITGVQGSALGSSGTGAGAGKSSALAWTASPQGWAFSGWFKCRASSSGARILVWRNASSEVAHAFYLSSAFQIRLYGASGNTGIVSPSGSTVTAETWTHLAASCNGLTIQFFKSGVFLGSMTYSQGALLQPNQLYVGGDTTDGSVADVDDLAVFDTPISEANVAWLFANPGQFLAAGSVSADAALSGTGTRTVTATVAKGIDAARTGTGTLTATATNAKSAAAALSGTGTLTATATITRTATAALAGTGTLTATATVTTSATAAAALSGTGTLTATATGSKSAAAALTGTGTLTGTATGAKSANAALSGTGTMTAVANGTAPATAALVGTGTLSASALGAKLAGASLTGTGTLTASASTTAVGGVDGALSGTGTLTATATTDKATAGTATATGTLTADAVVTDPATATLAGTVTATATAIGSRAGAAALTATVTATATAEVTGQLSAGAALMATVTATATAELAAQLSAGAALVALGHLSASASVTSTGHITPRPNTGRTIRPFTGVTPRP